MKNKATNHDDNDDDDDDDDDKCLLNLTLEKVNKT